MSSLRVVRASNARVFLIRSDRFQASVVWCSDSDSALTIFTFSNFHIFTFSHLHIFTSSHFHIFTFSHLQIFTSSHLLLKSIHNPKVRKIGNMPVSLQLRSNTKILINPV